MQVVGLGTRSRKESGNLRLNFSLTIYNVALHPELMYNSESLGIYQMYFLKFKNFHFFTEISLLLHSLGLKVRILTLISAFLFFFSFGKDNTIVLGKTNILPMKSLIYL